ncbi:MAG: CPBP family intramembrane metalloprotease [Flavobacteriales bacterium]|nr:CPBP family intramembrane metalloprotease [Flavobacteriales bacterium]
MNPVMKIMMLFCIVLMMISVSVAVGGAIATSTCGMSMDDLTKIMEGVNEDWGPCSLRLMNAANQLVGFFGAAILFGILFGWKSINRFMTGRPALTILLVPILAFFSFPLIDAAYQINLALIPEGGWIEELFKPMEESAAQATEALLAGTSTTDLLLNLFVIAFLPGLCEEFLFRGTLMPLIAKSSKNIHIGIWVSAAIFSAVHMQFYGFLPRLLLGVYFGYLVMATGSIWTAVFAHFIHNGSAAIAHFYAAKNNLDVAQMEAESYTWLNVLIAAIIFSLLFFAILQRSKWPKFKEAYLAYETIEDHLPPPMPAEEA